MSLSEPTRYNGVRDLHIFRDRTERNVAMGSLLGATLIGVSCALWPYVAERFVNTRPPTLRFVLTQSVNEISKETLDAYRPGDKVSWSTLTVNCTDRTPVVTARGFVVPPEDGPSLCYSTVDVPDADSMEDILTKSSPSPPWAAGVRSGPRHRLTLK